MELVPLAYAGPAVRPPLRPARRTAACRVVLACWLLPLAAGVVIFIASEVVRAMAPPGPLFPWHGGPPAVSPAFIKLAAAGVLTLFAGGGLAAVGSIAIGVFTLQRWRAATDRRRQVFGPAAVMAGLLASNFVVAAVIATVAQR